MDVSSMQNSFEDGEINREVLKDVIQRKTEKCVNILLKDSKYSDEEVDVIALAQRLGFKIANVLFKGDSLEGFIIIDKKKDKIMGIKTNMLIGVDTRLSVQKKRFLIAHELGHYFLHYRGKNYFAHRESKKGKDRHENAADYFAAALLMPQEAFITQYNYFMTLFDNNINNVIISLARWFCVEEDCILRRIKEVFPKDGGAR